MEKYKKNKKKDKVNLNMTFEEAMKKALNTSLTKIRKRKMK